MKGGVFALSFLPVEASGAMTDATAAVQSFFSTLTAGITVGDIVSMLGIAVGAGFVFVLGWFGVRKLTKVFTTALQRGKLKF